jgi:hypothetical protein
MSYDPEPEIKRYLKRLSKAAGDLPRARRRELLTEIEEHIREAVAETPVASEAQMRTLLDRLGDPAEIAAAAAGDPEVPARSTTLEIVAIVLLLVGGFLFLAGWLVGVVLLWSSSLWTLRDKLIGTLVIPGGLAAGFYAFFFLQFVGTHTCSNNGPTGASCTAGPSTLGIVAIVAVSAVLVLGPIGTAIYLGRRLNTQKHKRIGTASAAAG